MIFPKQQMKIQETRSDDLKKQGLQLIISLYLNRKKDQDISFLRNHFGSTAQFTSGVRSSLKKGLAFPDIQTNRILYGQNEKFPPQKCLSLKQCFIKELISLFAITSFILLISSTIYGQVKHMRQLSTSSEIMLGFNVAAILLRVFSTYYYSLQLAKTSLQKTKTNKYQVIRDGHLLEIQESQLVVGDIVQLGFKEKVPATGIMLTNREIYVKQNEQRQSVQLKSSLELCVRKIQSMSPLDLKLSFEQRTLPSPIILRGSQLIKGSTFSILIISVTEQNLLKRFGYNEEDNFWNKQYDRWMLHLTKKWKNWSYFLVSLSITILAFSHFTDYHLLLKYPKYSGDLFFQFLLQISILSLILNVAPFQHFLNLIFVKLMIKIKVIQNFEQFFKVQRILCNQRNIVDYDNITVAQIAVCQKIDLLGRSQLKLLNTLTAKIITQINDILGITLQQNSIDLKKKKKQVKIVHVNKKNRKIVSMISNSKIQNNVFKEVMKQITNIGNQPQNNLKIGQFRNSLKLKKLNDVEKQKSGSCHFLKIPKLNFEQNQEGQNLKQILHTRCRMRSKGLLDNLVELAQKGMRTYYLLQFDLENLQKVTHIILNGQVTNFTIQLKERIVMLARKMNLIYNLTPIMIGYNQGPYNQKPLKILVCVLGINIAEQNIIINSLNQLRNMGINSLIFIQKQQQIQDLESYEKQIFQQYKNRRWLTKEDRSSIHNSKQIRQLLKRLVCRQCWISNCDCKQKMQQVSNIQPFIQISSKIKVAYETDEQNLKYIQCAYKQLQNSVICINSSNTSALDVVNSILTCRGFIENLKRSVILFYAVLFVYFGSSLIFWVRNQQIVKPLQIGVSFCLIISHFGFCLLCNIKNNGPKEQRIQKQIKIVSKQKSIVINTICILTILSAQLFYVFSNKLPEYSDNYDNLIKKYALDEGICKYGEYRSITTQFQTSECSVPQINLQFSRLSTFICTYLYVTLWTMLVFTHRNFTHIGSIICYISSISIYICLIQLAPQVIHAYSEGLTWQHYCIIYVSIAVTFITGYILGWVICKIPITDYFNEQTESKMNFTKEEDQCDWTGNLKRYQVHKKLGKGSLFECN